jgi:two-component system, NtrC family, sensor kinase
MRSWPPGTPACKELTTLDFRVADKTKAAAPRAKILLLEDRTDFQSVLGKYLVSLSYEVASVSSGIEGVQQIMKRGFDVIICDMMMPKMGGEMFYWAVTRTRPATRNRFIFFTGHKNNPSLEFFFRRINARMLYKPFKLSALEAAINEILLKMG